MKLTNIQSILSIIATKSLHYEYLDVKITFLHGNLEKKIYIQQLEGFTAKGKENLVWRLTKSINGLKQALRQWYKRFDGFMQKNECLRCNVNHYCYLKMVGSYYIILLLYVDNMLVNDTDLDGINKLKK